MFQVFLLVRADRQKCRSAVDVLSGRRIGPFDVTRPAGNDATALANWLADNGFPHPGHLDEGLAPYPGPGGFAIAIALGRRASRR
jgi:hypothetical protein